MKKDFVIDIWDFVNIDAINDQLEATLPDDELPSDIDYECIRITKDGTLVLRADFEVEKIE